MRAEIIGLPIVFDVALELQKDGSFAAPADLSISMRPCWRKPPVEVRLAHAFTDAARQIAYYVKEERNDAANSR